MTTHAELLTQIVPACESDVRAIESLLDEHLRELSGHSDVPGGASDSTSYPYLAHYWSEPGRHPLLIQSGGLTVGFALVRSPASTGSTVHRLAEFYVEPSSRRLGIGQRAALAIWKRFPGQWELQVQAKNSAAFQFWVSCVEAAAKETHRVSEVQASDGRRLQFSFRV